MKKFQFRLQRILDLREKLEEEQQLKLAAASSAYRKILREQEYFFDKASQARAACAEKIHQGIADIEALKRADLLYAEAERLQKALYTRLEEARFKMEKEKAEYARLHREKKAVELLREKCLKEYKQEEIREETRIMDEISKKPKT